MNSRQVYVLVAAIFVLAVGVTAMAGTISPHLATEPFGEGIWWHTALRLAVPFTWMFLILFLAIGGVAWLIASTQQGQRFR